MMVRNPERRYGVGVERICRVALDEEIVAELAALRASAGAPVARVTFSLLIRGSNPPRMQNFDRLYNYRHGVPAATEHGEGDAWVAMSY